jgi:hypothetical protein
MFEPREFKSNHRCRSLSWLAVSRAYYADHRYFDRRTKPLSSIPISVDNHYKTTFLFRLSSPPRILNLIYYSSSNTEIAEA